MTIDVKRNAHREPIIETTDLTRRFGQTLAVNALNLCVWPGELVGLVGPDGAGKTTILRLLAGIMNPTAGRARVLGYDTVRQARHIHQHLGYMAQNPTLYPDLTVLENLNFYGDIYGVERQKRAAAIERLLHFSRMSEFKDRRAGRLSGGMQKKLALSCVLIHTPRLILLDEPTTGVDPVSRREFWDMLADLHADGVTVMLCTPYMDEAERCSKVGLVYHGQLLAYGSPREIRRSLGKELIAVWPQDLRAARKALENMPGIEEILASGDQLRLLVQEAQSLIPLVARQLEAAGIPFRDIRPSPVRMEDAFICLIRQQRNIPTRE